MPDLENEYVNEIKCVSTSLIPNKSEPSTVTTTASSSIKSLLESETSSTTSSSSSSSSSSSKNSTKINLLNLQKTQLPKTIYSTTKTTNPSPLLKAKRSAELNNSIKIIPKKSVVSDHGIRLYQMNNTETSTPLFKSIGQQTQKCKYFKLIGVKRYLKSPVFELAYKN